MPPIIPITLPVLLKLIRKGHAAIVTVPKYCNKGFPFGTEKGFANRFVNNQKAGALDSIDDYIADYMAYPGYTFYKVVHTTISCKE